MLSGLLPDYGQHGELLFRISATALHGYQPDELTPAAEQRGDYYEAPCLAPAVGFLGPQPRLFSSTALQAGGAWASSPLWASRGFDSRRLPGTSSRAALDALAAAHAARLGSEAKAVRQLQSLLDSWSKMHEGPAPVPPNRVSTALEWLSFWALFVPLAVALVVTTTYITWRYGKA